MSAHLDLELPCFFWIDATPAGRRHRCRLVVGPPLEAEGASPEQAGHRLVDKVRSLCDRAPERIPELLGVPSDARVGVDPLLVPTKKGRSVPAPVRKLSFRLGEQSFVALPRLRAVVAVPAASSPTERADAEQRAVDRWFRHRDDDEDDEGDEDVDRWSDRRGDRIVWLEARVRAGWPVTDVEAADGRVARQNLGKVSGADELPKVSRRLDARWPDGLLLDHVPDPARVDPLRRWLYEDERPVPTAIVGPSGCGKTTLVHAAVRRELDRWMAEDPRRAHRLAQVHHLDPQRIIAGQSIVGAWERRLLAILTHLVDPDRQRARDALYVDRPLALARVGRSAGSALTLTSILRPWLEARRLPFLVEATPEQWARLEELDRSFADLFQVIRLPAPTPDHVADVLLSAVERSTGDGGAEAFTGPALRALVDLERRFPSARGLPGGLVDRLTLAAQRHPGRTITDDTVRELFGDATGLRPEWVDRASPLPTAALQDRVAARLIGQPDAVAAIAELVHVLRAGLARPGRPLATWLLVGPTGTGKTETARVLADLLFERPDRLVRVDLNEYADAGAVTRLLGDGLVEGHLTSRLRGRGVAVLLLDELEKAHPAVVDLLLQVLDEGRITDASGRTLDLTRVAVLLTSNVGATEVARATGFGRDLPSTETTRTAFRSAVHQRFRPELVNRLDRILVFGHLGRDDAGKVARLQLAAVLRREGFLRRTVLVDVAPAALERLIDAGFDPASGGRSLQRSLEDGVAGGVAHVLAAAPLDRPMVLRLESDPDGPGVVARPTLLSFAARRGAPDPGADPTEAELRALRDALPAGAFQFMADASGTRLEGAAALAVRDRIDRALRAFDEDPDGTDVPDALLANLARRDHKHRGHRAAWRQPPVQWMGVVSFRSVREFLLDRSQTAEREEVALPQLPLLAMQVAALARGAGPEVVVELDGVVDHGPASWAAAEPYVAALEATLEALGATVVDEGARPRRLRVRGAAVAGWLRAEAGVHLLYPREGTPFGLRVRVDGDGDDTVVRLLVEGGEVEDLRTGLSCPVGDLAELLPTLWRAAVEPGEAP
jgi:energy-coupling factor transporter ATP-binding protein EcfA2